MSRVLAAIAARIPLVCVLSVLPLATAACDGVGASSSQRAATGGRWSAPMPIRGVRSLAAVSCATRSLCVAVGGRVAVSDHRGVWSAPATIDARAGVNDGLVTVSCASPRFCLAADAAGRVIRFDGTSWSKPATVDRAGLSEISCVSLRFCGAVDQAGEALFFNGSAWSAPSALPGGPQLDAIACTAGNVCMALDGAGVGADVERDGHWTDAGSLAVSTPQGGSEPDSPSAVACSGPGFCAALDDFGDAFTWTGRQWSAPSRFDGALADGSDAVSCASARFCMALDGDGVVSRWAGGSWSAPHAIDAADAGLAGVSCAAVGFCVAVDGRGHALSYGAAS